MNDIVISSLLILCWYASILVAQQNYSGNSIFACNIKTGKTEPSPAVLYTCNGLQHSCKAYLFFRSLPPYDSAISISNLTSSPLPELSRINNVSSTEILPPSSGFIVPVDCSCSGKYYQATTSYTIQNEGQSYYTIANETFEGLSTCDALMQQNPYDAYGLQAGFELRVPLRCACPNRDQTSEGVRFLLTYVTNEIDDIDGMSNRFNVSTESLIYANGFADENSVVYPFTTVLIPLHTIPSKFKLLDPPPPPPPPPSSSDQGSPVSIVPSPESSSSKKTWIYAVFGILGGISLVSTSALFVFCFCLKRRKKKNESAVVAESLESVEQQQRREKQDEEDLSSSESILNYISSVAQYLTRYTYEDLKLATDSFSPSCLLGGSVYRGTLKGDFAAIKKVIGDVLEEVILLSNIMHFNLTRLSGVCNHGGYWYLVFEYAAKGALSDWIYGKHGPEEKFLNWMQRIQIALDVASGLNYLHSYTSPPHVHRDLNCRNVLLDEEFRAKLTNFSLARTTDGPGGDQFALTRHIVGTKGYMAPEYLENGLVSPKLDVYSFGILLLEILTGKEVAVNLDLSRSLVPVLEDENGDQMLSKLMDPSLGGDYPSELAVSVIKLIHSCLKKDPSDRPDMHEIVQILSETVNASTFWASEHSV